MARKLSPGGLRRFMNVWPPYVGAGIHVTHIAPDWRSATVELNQRWYNRNFLGTHFGGSLYSMADPFFMLLLMHSLPDEYLVWDKSASIDFVAPGRGRVWARFEIADEDLAQIVEMTASGDKHLHLFKADVRDNEGMVVARVEKIVYVRRKRAS